MSGRTGQAEGSVELDIRETLTAWKIPNVVIEKLVDQMFTIHSLLVLTTPELSATVPEAGPRSLITFHLNKLRAEKAGEKPKEIEVQEPPEKRCRTTVAGSSTETETDARNDVHKALLNASVDGDIVLSFYQNEKKLNDYTRDILAEKIIFAELKPDLEKTIGRVRLSELADQVTELFPTESKVTWYDEVRKKNKKGKPVSVIEGRLRTKFYHTRNKLIEAKLISKRRLIEELAAEENLGDDAAEDNDTVVWLKNNRDPWGEILLKWEQTYGDRKREAEGVSHLWDYVKKYPGLLRTDGWELVLIDWKLDPISALATPIPDWMKLADFILPILRKEHPALNIKVDFASDDERLATALKYFPYIFKVRLLEKASPAKRQWKPSRVEIQEAFLLQINEIGSLQNKVKGRTDRLEEFGFSMQLMPVVVGPLDNIRQCLVVLDKLKWEMRSVQEMFDATFKLFFGLSAQYPAEAKHLWLFIQKALYNIELDGELRSKRKGGLRSFLAARFSEYGVNL